MSASSVLALASILAVVAMAAAVQGVQDEPLALAAPANEVMQAFTEAFEGIERGLDVADPEAVAVHARRLASTCGDCSALSPQLNQDMRATFDGYLASLARSSAEVAELASGRDLPGAALATEDLRALCTTCHVRFRRDSSTLGDRPAKGTTVTGMVALLDIDGRPRTDRSDVVVFLESTQPLGPFAAPRRHAVISQSGRRFSPRVLPVVRGSTVDFPNDDITFHNAFSRSRTRPFDLGIYATGETRSVLFRETGLVRVYCNIHPDMLSTILVLANPYFAVTDERGVFVITGVSAGDYTLRVWNELGGDWQASVEARTAVLQVDDIVIREDTVVIEHGDKFGRPYRQKY